MLTSTTHRGNPKIDFFLSNFEKNFPPGKKNKKSFKNKGHFCHREQKNRVSGLTFRPSVAKLENMYKRFERF